MDVCSFTVVVKNKLNLCGVLTFEFVCVHVQVMYAKLSRSKLSRMVDQSEDHISHTL